MNNKRKLDIFVIVEDKIELVSFPCEKGEFLSKFCSKDGTPLANYVDVSQFKNQWFYNVIDEESLSNIFSIDLILRFEKQFILNSIERSKNNIIHILQSDIDLDDEVYNSIEQKMNS